MELMEYQYTTRKKLLSYQERESNQLFLPTPVAGRKTATQSLQIWKGFTRELKEQKHRLHQLQTSAHLGHHSLAKAV
jgi:hypothetical protein